MTVLVLAIGSSSIRALLFDDSARLIPSALVTEPQQLETEPAGAATLDMPALQSRVESAMDQILQHPQARDIRVVGVATLVGNVLGVDQRGIAVTPVYTYADTRSAADVERLRKQVNADKKHQDTGCLLHTAYLPARLHWLRRTEPALFKQVSQWMDIGAYLYHTWFGQAWTSYSVASWSGLLNRAALTWDEEWLRLLHLPDAALSPLTDYDAPVSGLVPAYTARWPALRDVPFCLAVGDGVAANVGAGCVAPSHVAVTIGTTAALRTITDAALPPVPAGLWSYRVNERLHLIGGATSEGGNVYQWARETLKLPQDTEAALAERLPDAHGLTFLPLLAGERSPGWSPDATGALVGLRLSTSPMDILQAAMEAVAHRLAVIAEQIRSVAAPNATIIGSGGALEASPAWAQMVANALDTPLVMTQETELTARGAAILALAAIGKRSLNDFPPTLAGTVKPQSEHAAVFRAARERQTVLYDALIGKRTNAEA